MIDPELFSHCPKKCMTLHTSLLTTNTGGWPAEAPVLVFSPNSWIYCTPGYWYGYGGGSKISELSRLTYNMRLDDVVRFHGELLYEQSSFWGSCTPHMMGGRKRMCQLRGKQHGLGDLPRTYLC